MSRARPSYRLLAVPVGAATAALVALAAVASATGLQLPYDQVRAYAQAHGLTPKAISGTTGLPSYSAAGFGVTPRATCGAGSLPETGRQGRVPKSDYDSGRAAKGYRCNTVELGRYGTTGGFQVHRYVDAAGHECAFYDSTLLFPRDLRKDEPGTYVLDMSNPAKPVRTAVLNTPAMVTPHESLRFNAKRGLLVAGAGSATTQVGFVDVYDASADCRTPVLKSSLPVGVLGHEGGFSPDGRTYWVTTTFNRGITAIDLTDPAVPSVIWQSFDYAAHGLSLSADGTRAYLADVLDTPTSNFVSATTQGGGGLQILDVSQIQRRVANPVVTELSKLRWPEVTIPQNSVPVTIGGRKYLIEFDEYDENVFQYAADEKVGAARIIDITNERLPKVVSRIRLAVHEKEGRADQGDDPGAKGVGQGYAAHYCAVPREVEPGIVACSMIASGLRIFDIRNPLRPREVAYFNAPKADLSDPSEGGGYAMSAPAFVPQRREIWYVDSNTGFHALRVTSGAWPTAGR
jgi:hypothetical protein